MQKQKAVTPSFGNGPWICNNQEESVALIFVVLTSFLISQFGAFLKM